MPVGKCKLCLHENQELQKSHLMPKALYRMLLSPGVKNPNPVIVSEDRTVQSSKQMKAALLCHNCEQRLCANGENWVMRQVCRGTKFPLLDTLRRVPYDASKDGIEVYSCATRVDIDLNSLGYFAASVLWRAAIHDWMSVGVPSFSLGPYDEVLRKYLIGETPFPNAFVVSVTACTDFFSQQIFHDPAPLRMSSYERCHSYTFLTRGIRFDMYLGNFIPPEFRRLCSITSSARYIFVRSDEYWTLKLFAGFQATTKLARNLL